MPKVRWNGKREAEATEANEANVANVRDPVGAKNAVETRGTAEGGYPLAGSCIG
jgi:hypothetical protein